VDNLTPDHKFLNLIEHIWPVISGLVLAFVVTIRWWWHIAKSKLVTKEELIMCKAKVDDQSRDDMVLILGEIKSIHKKIDETSKATNDKIDSYQRMNSQQHQDILLANGGKSGSR
jgi:hypothetical protein